MKKEDAVRIITECAKQYHKNLAGKNVLFLFGSSQKQDYFEVSFLPRNYLHLTGVKLVGNSVKSSVHFYNLCLRGKLRLTDFSLPSDGMADLKLTVLPQLMSIHKNAKMVGNFNNYKPFLITDKLAGNISACMGFVLNNKYYVPNTVLKHDIRDITAESKRVIATFRKPISSSCYTELCYVAKGIELLSLSLPTVISLENHQ